MCLCHQPNRAAARFRAATAAAPRNGHCQHNADTCPRISIVVVLAKQGPAVDCNENSQNKHTGDDRPNNRICNFLPGCFASLRHNHCSTKQGNDQENNHNKLVHGKNLLLQFKRQTRNTSRKAHTEPSVTGDTHHSRSSREQEPHKKPTSQQRLLLTELLRSADGCCFGLYLL